MQNHSITITGSMLAIDETLTKLHQAIAVTDLLITQHGYGKDAAVFDLLLGLLEDSAQRLTSIDNKNSTPDIEQDGAIIRQRAYTKMQYRHMQKTLVNISNKRDWLISQHEKLKEETLRALDFIDELTDPA